jgi:hypothetical protein
LISTTIGVDDQAFGDEVVDHFHRRLKHAPRVVTQVEDDAAELLAVVFAQLGQGLGDLFACLDLELGDADVAVAGLQQLALHALHLNDGADQGHVERRTAVAYQGQGDLLANLAAHLVDGFGHALAASRLAVDLDDEVAGLNARLGGRGVIDGRNHFDETVFGADFDAQAAEFAAGAFLQFSEVFRAEVRGVRVEVAEHAFDGVFQQGLVVHRFHIGCLDPVHDFGKSAQLVQRQWRLGGRSSARRCDHRGRLSGKRQRCADHQGNRQGQRGKAGQIQHVERTPNVGDSTPILARDTIAPDHSGDPADE